MASLVVIDPPRSASERQAQQVLARILPAGWVVTTNIYEEHFPKRDSAEIDGLVICPMGVFVLSLKDHTGSIIPVTSGQWGGLKEESNPLNRASRHMYVVKNFIEGQLEERVWF